MAMEYSIRLRKQTKAILRKIKTDNRFASMDDVVLYLIKKSGVKK